MNHSLRVARRLDIASCAKIRLRSLSITVTSVGVTLVLVEKKERKLKWTETNAITALWCRRSARGLEAMLKSSTLACKRREKREKKRRIASVFFCFVVWDKANTDWRRMQPIESASGSITPQQIAFAANGNAKILRPLPLNSRWS